jgi:hypothetical protein
LSSSLFPQSSFPFVCTLLYFLILNLSTALSVFTCNLLHLSYASTVYNGFCSGLHKRFNMISPIFFNKIFSSIV